MLTKRLIFFTTLSKNVEKSKFVIKLMKCYNKGNKLKLWLNDGLVRPIKTKDKHRTNFKVIGLI